MSVTAATRQQPDPCALLDRIKANVPRPLLDLSVWLLHRNKRPIYADGTPRRGKLDSREDRARLVTYKQIEEALFIEGGDGVGVALGPVPGTGFVLSGIDLDHCYVDGQLDERAGALLATVQSYAEKSPSAKGLHILGLGNIGTAKVNDERGGVEIYSRGRYFTVTGDALNSFGMVDLSEPAALARRLYGKASPLSPSPTIPSSATVIEGGRNTFLTREAGKLQRGALHPFALSAALHELNRTLCRPPLPDPEVEAIARSIQRYPPQPAAGAEPQDVMLLCATDIHPEPISWLWLDWLARGKFEILAGAPGCGKTTIALKFAATITTGGSWPDNSRAPVSNVLIWSGEDDPQDTLLPRLLAMGADRKRIYFVNGTTGSDGQSRPFDPAQDMETLREKALTLGDVGFMIVDPIVNAVAGDSHKNSETRRSLQPVVDLAVQLGASVLGISHYTKGTQGRDPIERVTGSIAFGAVPRIILGAAKVLREDGSTDRILVRAKSNIGPDGGGYAYTLDQVELTDYPGLSASSVHWGPPLDGSAQNLLTQAEAASGGAGTDALSEARNFLRVELASGRVPSKELKSRAGEAGISERTLKRAKSALRVGAHLDGTTRTWYWMLPHEFEEIGQEGQEPPIPIDGPLGLLDPPSRGTESQIEGQGGQEGQPSGMAPSASQASSNV